jgi:FkbM family methyltransferase
MATTTATRENPSSIRDLARVLRAPFAARHYAALFRMVRDCPDWPTVLRAYLTGRGAYPLRVRVRTPIGTFPVVLHHAHDVLTLNEIFFRYDYPTPPAFRVAVDIGANIGLAALWFLTRNADAVCYCYEPVPSNVEKLRATLAGLEGRYELSTVAVADRAGDVRFGLESTGRYGGIDQPFAEQIVVRCEHVADVLGPILERHGRIDVLKVDTEGAERATLSAIPPALLARVARVVAEDPTPNPSLAGAFSVRCSGTCCQYDRRAAAPT